MSGGRAPGPLGGDRWEEAEGSSVRQLWSIAGTAEQASGRCHCDMKMGASGCTICGRPHSDASNERGPSAEASSCGSATVAQPACTGVEDTVGVSENEREASARDQGWSTSIHLGYCSCRFSIGRSANCNRLRTADHTSSALERDRRCRRDCWLAWLESLHAYGATRRSGGVDSKQLC